MKNVTETLHTLVELLDQLLIDYAVMGGFAVRAHGVPRPTYDIDWPCRTIRMFSS